MSAKTRGQDASSKAAAAAATCHHLIPVTAIRVAVTFAKAGIGPGRTQSTLGAVSIKAPIKATAFETMVAETAMAHLYGPALRCSVAAETAVVRLDPGDSEGVVVRRDPMACETGAAKTKTANMASAAKTKTANMASAVKTKTANMASAAKTKTTDVASAAKTKTANMASAAKTKTTDVASAAQATDMASAAKATAPCERDCAGRRCRYAEHDGRTCCNQLLTHFFKLLMFHLIWITSVRPLCSRCCDWFTIAPIWKDRQNQEVVQGTGRGALF
jgi:trimeric autotransporter adhesin